MNDLLTPLYDIHLRLGGRMVSFGGYLLPVQYAGIAKEHNAVRESVGIFDVSHMGEFLLKGANALNAVSMLVTNDISMMYPGQVKYSPMCNERGGVVDDLLIYMLDNESFMLVVNASNKRKDFDWIKAHIPDDVTFTDMSDDFALIALQGKNAVNILKKLTAEENIPEKSYTFTNNRPVAGFGVIISRTGYTGEDGFEFYVNTEIAVPFFEELFKAGEEYNIAPCGLGARDTLRFEASMPLYGHEMNDDITPLEIGLKMFVKMDKPDFVGKAALIERGDPKVKRVGLELIDKGIARERCPVYAGDVKIGETTSGTMSPYSGKALAMAIIPLEYAKAEDIKIDVRGRMLSAKIVPMPFYKRG